MTPAERLLNLYETKWQHNVDHVFKHLLYWWWKPMLDRACRCTLIQKLILIHSTPESEGLSSGTGAQLLVSCWRGNRCTARVLCLQITSLGTDHCALTSPPCVCLQGDGTNHCLYRPFLFSFRDENAVWKISPIFCMMGTVFPPSFVSFWIVGMFVRG